MKRLYKATFYGILVMKKILIWSKEMNYKKDLSEQNQKLLLKINVNVEDREYLAEEVEKNINDIGNYIISKSSKNGDINRAQLEYIPLINVLENYIEKKNK